MKRVVGEDAPRRGIRRLFGGRRGAYDPNEVLVPSLTFLLLIPAYFVLSGRRGFLHFFFFGWPRAFYRAVSGGFPLSGDTTAFIAACVVALPLGYLAARWLRKSAPKYIVIAGASGFFVLLTGFVYLLAEYLEPATRQIGFLYPIIILLALYTTYSGWRETFKPLDLAKFGRAGAATNVFDGSPESIEALQRFASGSAPSRAESARMPEAPSDIRGLSPEAVQELMARVKAGERYEDVAASLLARGAARPVEADKRAQGPVKTYRFRGVVLHGFTSDDFAELVDRVERGEAGEDVVASIYARGAGRSVEVDGERPRATAPRGKLGDFDDL